MAQSEAQAQQSESSNFVGQVKWFNNRLGYGFITIISSGEQNGSDIFVHQQHITPKTSDYRSLQQGEYVSFQLGTADSNSEGEAAKHTNQAVKVTGVYGGTLMCDQIPRRAPSSRPTTSTYSSKPTEGAQSTEQSTETSSRPSRPPRVGGTPRGGKAPAGRGRPRKN
jgi:cold shock CspA family protein